MPQDGSNNYNYPPGTPGISGETIESEAYNTFIDDLVVNDLNWPRPVHRGGTGATTANQALTNLTAEKAKQVVTNFDDHVWMNGSFYSDASATGAPLPTTPFLGIYYANITGNEVVEARVANIAPAGVKYVKQKVAGVWGAWTVTDGSDRVAKAGDIMTGGLQMKTAPISGIVVDKNRWMMSLGEGTDETGTGNAGSNFKLGRYDDAGVLLANAMEIQRHSGDIAISGGVIGVGVGKSGTAIGQVSINGGAAAGGGAMVAFRRDGSESFILSHSSPIGVGTGNDFVLYNFHASAKTFDVDAALNRMSVAGDPVAALGVATKQYVDSHGFTTGDVKFTMKNVAEAGWLIFSENTNFGSASSGASFPSATTQALFELLYNNVTDAWAPIYTSAGAGTTRAAQGGSATAWANNCRMRLPLALGRALAVAGQGGGLSNRPLGSAAGTENVTLPVAAIPSHAHSSTTGTAFVTIASGLSNYDPLGAGSIQAAAAFTANEGGGSYHDIVQASVFLNTVIKL